ncbi:hypothetical protein [Pedobacter mucosus]|uniref:hypothetical protein n=1 Tax=Pedobacter mucosus TaxID=2895286 RepID=UPI001EE4A587|nr:hypothetical protein [Pedobacter mucosus]UKT66105.1 hypothetical protein LOK61_09990 [Pedobacter mucosus]
MKLKIYLIINLLAISCLLVSCSKENETPEVKNHYLIRVKNISEFNYLDVRVIPVPPLYFYNFGQLGVGETSQYYDFDKAYAKIDVSVKYSETFTFGLLNSHDLTKEIEQLTPGKYLLEVKLTKNPNFSVETKLIKE